jgi:hypothetical protein
MQRRELLRLLTAAAVAPVLPPNIFALLRQAHPSPGYSLRTLMPHQNDTVVAMAELIIPATDTPGATTARVNEFIDLILTDWATPEESADFLNGLNDVDTRSNALFAKNFVDASPGQQISLLRALDDQVDWSRSYSLTDESALAGKYDMQMQGEFFRVFKTITLHGYYTSEIGFSQELKLEIIPGSFHGCDHVPEGKKD